ncbi:MAG: aspartate aminotransferase family protein [Saprospiraceae bacterium]|nr:aspartate aminotransferase family protein [Saprospiraceae bacterium]MBP7679940.1 aspartate aminotransferase family protein [Saprospiraceae bacterium]
MILTTAPDIKKTINIITPIPGEKSRAILARRAAAIPAGSAKATEVVIASAKDAVVTDVDGNTLLDFAGGIGVLNAGHLPDVVVTAVKQQLDKLMHACIMVATYEPPIILAEMLNKLVPGNFAKKSFFYNSGSEAVDNAISIARYATQRPAVVVFEGAYHGRTMLTMSLTSKYNVYKNGYGSMSQDIYRFPIPNMYRTPEGMTEAQYLAYCINRLDDALISQVDPSAIAAFLIEPIQGEGGFVPIPTPFLQKLRSICDKHNIVLIFDEIQSGIGRTGKLFACEYTGVIPDMMTIAKSLAAGMPIAAITGKAEVMDAPHLGGMGGTYSGNPLSCVAAIEVLKMVTTPTFMERANHIGNIMATMLQRWKAIYAIIGDVRGKGAMQAIEFVKNKTTKEPYPEFALAVIKVATSQGLILIRGGLYGNCIRLLPPLVITDEQLHEGLSVLENVIRSVQQKGV